MEQSKAIKARMAILDLHLTAKQPPVLFSPPTPTPTPIPTSKFLIPFAKPRLHHHKNIIPNIPFSSFRNGSNTPSETECPVPLDQQPINEYQNLSTSFPFSWAADDFIEYSSRLFVVGAAFVFFVGLPVAWFGSVRPELEPLKPILAALSSGILVIWVKTSEVLARDRLLGSFSVKPVLSRLKYTLLTLATSLFVCILLFINVGEAQKGPYPSEAAKDRAIPGVYNDDSARSFEPDAFCGEPNLS
ncbi:uncharacterized protein ycf36 isoform X3 [Hevea brasiliensis]|uniref:uncharacterized protein ycf36 isoform X3 n=1 Tax=Hevea brasiliensis TaxID=3981 RepID=UPI0025F16F81|nr:uncharacterized protein ycf36 isoform X3 [Hevea brasiliensis]